MTLAPISSSASFTSILVVAWKTIIVRRQPRRNASIPLDAHTFAIYVPLQYVAFLAHWTEVPTIGLDRSVLIAGDGPPHLRYIP